MANFDVDWDLIQSSPEERKRLFENAYAKNGSRNSLWFSYGRPGRKTGDEVFSLLDVARRVGIVALEGMENEDAVRDEVALRYIKNGLEMTAADVLTNGEASMNPEVYSAIIFKTYSDVGFGCKPSDILDALKTSISKMHNHDANNY